MTNCSTYTSQQAHDDITALFDAYYDAKKAGSLIPPNKRIESADAIVEQYVEVNGQRPPKGVLSRLATYVLLDELSDPYPDKMSRDEYPIASYAQVGRYYKRNLSRNDFDKPVSREYGTVKRPFTTDDGAVWVSNSALISPYTDDYTEFEMRQMLYEILPERDAFVVEQTYIGGLKQREIAEMLGIDRSRVSRILSRATDRLRDILRIR